MKLKVVAVLAILMPLAACTSMQAKQERAEHVAHIQAAAGKPVNHFQLVFRNFYSWDALNDHQVVAYVTPKRAYLLDLTTCPGLDNTTGIAITSRMDQISVNFDSVTPMLTGVPCQIKRIRPLDMNKLKQLKMSEHDKVKVVPRSKQTQAPPDTQGGGS